jgi:hypothetical protein
LQDNLRFAEKKIRNLVRIGRVKLQDLVVVPIDCAPGKVYKLMNTYKAIYSYMTYTYIYIYSIFILPRYREV